MGMAIRGSGQNADVEAQVDTTHKALRVSIRPIEVGLLGSYSVGLASGVMAAGLAAGSVIAAFKWATAGIICRVSRVRLTANTDATAFAQGSTIFDLIRAQALPAQYTGGQTLSLLTKSQARATRFSSSSQQIAASAVGNIAVAGTATLVAGTPAPTLDNNPLHVVVGGAGANPSIALVPAPGLLIDPTEAGRQALELLNGEGFAIRATVPATGTWKFGVEIDWDEIDHARYLGLIT
jgi:hypothetical protein